VSTMNSRPLPGAADVNWAADSNRVSRATDVSEPCTSFLLQHQLMLQRAGIPLDFALSVGIRSVTTAEHLPLELSWTASQGGVPAVLFPWIGPDGTRNWQLRPDEPIVCAVDEEPRKYVQSRDVRLLNVLGSPASAEEVWLVEGTKQCVAGGAHCLPGCGCRFSGPNSSIYADLRILDDIGLLPVASDAAEGLYRLVDAAYEKRSVAVSSNLHPAAFDELMPKTLATATVDRLLHHAHVCQTSGDSVRLSQALAGQGGEATDLSPTVVVKHWQIPWPPPGNSRDRQRAAPIAARGQILGSGSV
jgi:hypothetical protein